MKYIYYLLTIFCFFIFFGNISASSFSTSISCEKEMVVDANESFYCYFNFDVNGARVKEVKFSLSIDDEFSSEFIVSDDWQLGSKSDDGEYVLTNKEGITGKTVLGKILVTSPDAALSNINISLTSGSVIDLNDNNYSFENVFYRVRVKNNDAKLKSVSIDDETYEIVDGVHLKVYTEKSSVNISAVTNDDNAQIVYGTGTKALEYGDNVMEIDVKAEDGTMKTHFITVHYIDNRDDDSLLKNLSVSNCVFDFSSKATFYYLRVSSSISYITISASANSSKATVTGSGKKKLEFGDNTFNIVVSAEAGNTTTYTIVVNRANVVDDNNYLDYILVNDDKITTDKENFYYFYTVNRNVKDVDIKVKTNSDKATAFINNKSLAIGENVINIVVKASSGAYKTYFLVITMEDVDELVLSDNNYLTNLSVYGYALDFDMNVFEYDLTINDKDKKLIMSYTTEDERANINIIGNENLKTGDVVIVKVMAEDGSEREYKIKITKDENVKSNPHFGSGETGRVPEDDEDDSALDDEDDSEDIIDDIIESEMDEFDESLKSLKVISSIISILVIIVFGIIISLVALKKIKL